MLTHPSRPWHQEFAPETLGTLREVIPLAVHRAQARSARAHAAWADPDGDQYVYGGMSRAVQKELASLLSSLPSFRQVEAPGTRRKLTFVGQNLLYPIRIGKKMPRNRSRIRIPYMSEGGQAVLETASMTKYDPPPLFASDEEHEEATLGDALARLAQIGRESLMAIYYSSVPDGVGSIYWAPAKLSGSNYLDCVDPEQLSYSVAPPQARAASEQQDNRTFADGTRPRTTAKLRPKPRHPGLQ